MDGAHHVADDDSADGADTQPCAPRYELSWRFDEVDPATVEHALRERICVSDDEQQDWLHRRLVGLGHDANARGHHFMAHSWFECAFCVKGSTADLLSSVNMRLKLAQPTLVALLYGRALQMELTEAQREMIRRKLKEAQDAAAQRQQDGGGGLSLEDEFGQLTSAPASQLGHHDTQRMLRLLRHEGHACNRAHDYDQACHWFDGAFALSRAGIDLLSAANMRVKIGHGPAIARALYLHAFALPSLNDRHREVAERKLDAIAEQEAAAARRGIAEARGVDARAQAAVAGILVVD